MSLRSVNLNLLPILRVLLRERNVSRAATILGMTQPAASAALAKLRIALNDPLLIRVGGRLERSARGGDLLEQVERACVILEDAWGHAAFDPRRAERSFTIAARDYVQAVLAPAIIETIARDAPRVSLQFVEISAQKFLENHGATIDLVLSSRLALEALGSSELTIEPLFSDRVVMVIGPRHRLYAAETIEGRDLDDDRFTMLLPGIESLHDRLQDFTGEFKPPGRVALRSQNINSLLLVAMQSDVVALVPQRLVTALAGMLPLRIAGEAFDGRTIEMMIAWNRWHTADPGHRWFRNLVKRIARPPTC